MLALMSSCRSKDKPIVGKLKDADALQHSTVGDLLDANQVETRATVHLPPPRKADLNIRDNIGKEWSSEAFVLSANKQLKLVAQLIEGSTSHHQDTMNELVAADFRCTAFTSPELVTVFSEPPVKIERSADGTSERPFRGLDGFVSAVSSLRASFGAANLMSKFKVTRVSLASDSKAETTIRCQIVGKSSEKIVHHSSVWECTWLISSAQAVPLLHSLDVVLEERSSKILHTVESGEQVREMFADCTESVIGENASYREQLAYGVDYWLGRIEQRFGINSSGWQGISVGDVNGDGLDDVYVCQPGGLPNRLFVQKTDGTADDRTAEAGLGWWDHSHAALFVDVDGDSDQDLILATALGLIFMSNDGVGTFEVKASQLCPEAMPFSIAAADYDRDGDLDVYASCYSPRGNAIATQFLARPVPYHDANNGGRNVLFRNDANWQFKNVTRSVGLDENNRRFSLAAAWEDYDNDGDQDLYVANDYGRNNLYRNDNGQFSDVALEAGVEDISAGMSVSWGDYDHDGQMDLYVSNMWSSAGNRITYQRNFQPDSKNQIKAEFQRHARGNSLFRNMGDGTFRDVSTQANVTMGRWAWGSRFIDINNDGWEDLLVANGFITQEDTTDL